MVPTVDTYSVSSRVLPSIQRHRSPLPAYLTINTKYSIVGLNIVVGR
jgi:hypothetical protein